MPQIIQHSMFDNKRCSRCRQFKQLEDFSTCPSHKDGRANYCKECHKAYAAKHYLANKEKMNAQSRANYYQNRDYYREINNNWYRRNRDAQLARFREYRKVNLEYFRQYDRDYYIVHKERLNAQNRDAYARNKAERKIKGRLWRRANRAICNALFQRRRARLKGAPGSHTASEWQALRDWFGGVCLRCGSQDDLTADHVMPLVKGGSNSIDNLQPLCRSCNSTKHDKSVDYRNPDQLAAFLATVL